MRLMNTGSQELGELLSELKARSGRSYQVIGRKVYTSKSTVQRYCTGSCVPREFAVIERIAQVCGATADEIARLSRLWAEATSPAAATSTPTTATERIDPDAPARWPPAARRRWRLGAALATTGLAVLIVLAISAGAPSHPPPQP